MKTKHRLGNRARNFILISVTILTGTCSLNMLRAQNPEFTFAKKMGGTSVEEGKGIAVNHKGASYTIGYFKGAGDFDPGAGTATLTSNGDADIFISKLDYYGNYKWAKRIGGAGDDRGLAILTDADGYIYCVGYFSGANVDFDPSTTAAFNLTSNGGTDIFVTKMDSLGNLVSAYNIGSAGNDQAVGLSYGWDEHLFITGFFSGTMDFNAQGGINNLPPVGGKDGFVLKVAKDLTFQWAKRLGGATDDFCTSISYIDHFLGIYVVGNFTGSSVDIYPGAGTNLTSNGGSDVFVLKLDANNGNFGWAKSAGGSSNDTAYSVVSDFTSGTVYVTGNFSGANVDFDPRTTASFNLTSAGATDAFIWKLSKLGNLIWAKGIGGAGAESSRSLTNDMYSYLYVTGCFASTTVDFDPGSGTANLSTAGSSDIFLLKLDTTGNYLWAGKMGSTGTDAGNFVTTDLGDNIKITGLFTGTVDFDAGAGTMNLVSAGSCDAFLTKYNQNIPQSTESNCIPITPTQYRNWSGTFNPVSNSPHKSGYQLVFQEEFDSSMIRMNYAPTYDQNSNARWEEKSQPDGYPDVYYKNNTEGNTSIRPYTYGVSVYDSHISPSTITTLSINLNPESIGGKSYSAGWLESVRTFKYGYFEIRAKMPPGQAMWPSYWLRGASYPATWDEIDIFENVDISGDNDQIFLNYHGMDHGYPVLSTYTYVGENSAWFNNPCEVNPAMTYNLAETFHTYGMEWSAGRIDFYFDNVIVNSIYNDCNVPEDIMFLVIANTMDPNTSIPHPSTFPQSYLIDYIRVYKKIATENYGTVAGGYGAEHPRMMTDVNNDGKADIVAYGGAGVYVSRAYDGSNFSTLYTSPTLAVSNFGYDQGYRIAYHIRTTADVNGDGKDDIVAFGGAGVYVSTSYSTTAYTAFNSPTLWVANYGSDAGAGGWTVTGHPRVMADVNGDGKDDVVGFGGAGVYVSLSSGTAFGTPSLWTANYGYDAGAGAWRTTTDERMMADVNGDGKADVVGFKSTGVYVSLSTGSGFSTPVLVTAYFGNASPYYWNVTTTPRMMADVNGDGKADIVGFYYDGVHIAISTSTSSVTFNTQSRWTNHFGVSWTVTSNPRMMADLNGDGMADIVGFKDVGVYVAFSTATGFSDTTQWTDFYGTNFYSGSFTVANNPRMTADVNADCRKDIVAFGDSGVFVTLSPKCAPFLYRHGNPNNEQVVSQNQNPVQADLVLYPNPGSGQFKLVSTDDISSIVICDLTGRIVYQSAIGAREVEIDISSEAKGVYFVKSMVGEKLKITKYINQ